VELRRFELLTTFFGCDLVAVRIIKTPTT